MTTITAPAGRKRHSTPVDPRIRQRRIEVQRSAGRRRLRRLGVLGAVAVLLAGLVALSRSPLLAVRHVRVEGASQTSTEAIVAASGVRVGRPLLDVSTGAARREIARLPWVKSVSVRKAWPSTLVLQVTERTPVAVMADGSDGWLELDESGRVLARSATAPAGLVPLTGLHQGARPGDQLDAPPGLLELAAAVPASLRPSVVGVSADPGGLALQLRGGGVAQLGDDGGLTAKLVSVQSVLTSRGATPECIDRLDVTVPSAPALTPRAGCA